MIVEIVRGDYSVGKDGKKVEVDYALGSPDGVQVCRYTKGKVYDMPEELGESFVRKGKAKESNGKPKQATDLKNLTDSVRMAVSDRNPEAIKLAEEKAKADEKLAEKMQKQAGR